LAHGGGAVELRVMQADRTVVIQVSDHGRGVTGDQSRVFARRHPEARGTGIGLALARSLVEADGGRLELTRAVPATFSLLLVAAGEPSASDRAPGAPPDRAPGAAASPPGAQRRAGAPGGS
jgi:signal transduction histidine kinase